MTSLPWVQSVCRSLLYRAWFRSCSVEQILVYKNIVIHINRCFASRNDDKSRSNWTINAHNKLLYSHLPGTSGTTRVGFFILIFGSGAWSDVRIRSMSSTALRPSRRSLKVTNEDKRVFMTQLTICYLREYRSRYLLLDAAAALSANRSAACDIVFKSKESEPDD